jgi:hypothetical protein
LQSARRRSRNFKHQQPKRQITIQTSSSVFKYHINHQSTSLMFVIVGQSVLARQKDKILLKSSPFLIVGHITAAKYKLSGVKSLLH